MSKRICVFGDSITKGHCDNEMGGWVNRLDLDLYKNTNEEFSVYNFGISSDTTTKLLKRIEVECMASEPSIIMIAIGVNDSYYRNSLNGNKVLIEDYEKNLLELLKISYRFTRDIIFIGLTSVIESETTPTSWDSDLFYLNKNIKEYNSILEKVARENNLLFISMDDALNDSDYEDGLHPNSDGHRKMYEKIRNFLYINKIIV